MKLFDLRPGQKKSEFFWYGVRSLFLGGVLTASSMLLARGQTLEEFVSYGAALGVSVFYYLYLVLRDDSQV